MQEEKKGKSIKWKSKEFYSEQIKVGVNFKWKKSVIPNINNLSAASPHNTQHRNMWSLNKFDYSFVILKWDTKDTFWATGVVVGKINFTGTILNGYIYPIHHYW